MAMAEDALPPELEILARDAGTWDAEVSINPGGGAPPIASRGVSTSRMTCGGRWLVTDFQNETGFEGHGVVGYDPARGRYVSTWVDNMRSFLVITTGTWDAARRVMTFHSEATIGGKQVRWREETETVGDDRRVFRQYFPGPDGELETMSVTYVRRRGS
jgi:hypothetical protein